MTENTTPDPGALREQLLALVDRIERAERMAEVNYRLADERSAWKSGYDDARERADEWERNSRNWQRRAEAAEAERDRLREIASPQERLLAEVGITWQSRARRLADRLAAAHALADEWDQTAQRCERRHPTPHCCSTCVARKIAAADLRAALAQPATDAACGPNGAGVDAGGFVYRYDPREATLADPWAPLRDAEPGTRIPVRNADGEHVADAIVGERVDGEVAEFHIGPIATPTDDANGAQGAEEDS